MAISNDLKVSHLGKKFVGKDVIDDVSFQIDHGEIVVLLGPSGCGKTTTLRCIAGLEQPTSGTIRIGDKTVDDPAAGVFVSTQKRALGMVFQSYAIWSHLSVEQNIAYPLKVRGVSRADMQQRVAEVLDVVGLAGFGSRNVGTLSGGQMQRIALARSLVYRPRIILLDEPLSNLDAKLRLRLRDDLRQIIKKAGLTGLYVTHDLTEAVAIGDRIGVMRSGKLVQMATAEELYNRPADLFVADFTGSSNRVPVHVVSQGDGVGVVSAQGLKLRVMTQPGLREGDTGQLILRPENIRLGPDGPDDDNVAPAQVRAVTFHGTQSTYRVESLGAQLDVAELGTRARYAVGDRLQLRFSPEFSWCLGGDGAPAHEDDVAHPAPAYA